MTRPLLKNSERVWQQFRFACHIKAADSSGKTDLQNTTISANLLFVEKHFGSRQTCCGEMQLLVASTSKTSTLAPWSPFPSCWGGLCSFSAADWTDENRQLRLAWSQCGWDHHFGPPNEVWDRLYGNNRPEVWCSTPTWSRSSEPDSSSWICSSLFYTKSCKDRVIRIKRRNRSQANVWMFSQLYWQHDEQKQVTRYFL